MPEHVMISLRYGGREEDFDISTRVSFAAMEDSLKRAIRLRFDTPPLQDLRVRLRGPEGLFDPDKTPEDYGVFDGALLELELL